MAKSKFTTLDRLSLQDIDGDAELIPLMTPEDEEAINKEELPVSIPILPLRNICLLYTSPSPRDLSTSRMPSSA